MKIINIVFDVFVIIMLIFLFSSCNPAKRLEKAKQLVLTDKPSFEEVGKKFLDLNPCINIPIYKSDTINVHDTTMHFEHYTDSIHHTDTVKEIITVTNTKIIKDTTTIIDGQQVKLLTESMIKKDLQIATMNGQIIAANNATKDADSRANKWKLYFYSLLSFIGLVGILKIIAAFSPSSSTANILKKLKL